MAAESLRAKTVGGREMKSLYWWIVGAAVVALGVPEVAVAAKPTTRTKITIPRSTTNRKITTIPPSKKPTASKPKNPSTAAKRATRVGQIQKKRTKKNHHHHHGPVHGIVTGVQHSKSGGGTFEVRVVHKHHHKKHHHSASRKPGGKGFKQTTNVPRPRSTGVKHTSTTSGHKYYATNHTHVFAVGGSRGSKTTHQVGFNHLKKGDEVLVFANKSLAHKVDILSHHKHHKKSKKKKSV
jgi:hypothetical protein